MQRGKAGLRELQLSFPRKLDWEVSYKERKPKANDLGTTTELVLESREP